VSAIFLTLARSRRAADCVGGQSQHAADNAPQLIDNIDDPRTRHSDYPLREILFIAVVAYICGSESNEDIATFGRTQLPWFRQFIPLENGIPTHDTFRRIFMLLKPNALEEMCKEMFQEGGGDKCQVIGGSLSISNLQTSDRICSCFHFFFSQFNPLSRLITGSVYDYPNVYDALFSDLCRSETKFLSAIFERFCPRKGDLSLFEPASGSGRLVYHLAKLGYDVTGLDLNPHAVAFCNRRLRRHGLPESAYNGNMASFSLADLHRKKKFDVAFNFVSSFLHLTAKTEAEQHMHAVADVLKSKGIYLLGIHLKPEGKIHPSQESWTLRRGSLAVKSRLHSLSQDAKKRVETVQFQIEAETPKKRYKIVDRFLLRTYTAKQFSRLLATVDRFDIVATYSFDYDISHPITVTGDTVDVVYVLRRR
jgi:SAM-dependent methyltransferase